MQTEPVNAEWIAGRYATLRGIYYVPDLDDRQLASILDDWRHALSGIPGAFVAAAFKAWISAETRRPTPADIAGMAGEMVADARKRLRPQEVARPADYRDECFKRYDPSPEEVRQHDEKVAQIWPRLKKFGEGQ